jgi:hypothetical protein
MYNLIYTKKASKYINSLDRSTRKNFPNNDTIEDIIHELDVRAKIEKGIQELDNGEYYSHNWVKGNFGGCP